METQPVPRDSILAELEKVLSSSTFTGAERSKTLLKFLVEHTARNGADRLKEYTIGADALGKGESFDPRTDPIVRAEASRLRGRLERYYAFEGQADAVALVLPKGSYVPRFESRVQPATVGGSAMVEAAPARSVWGVRLSWLASGVAAGAAAAAIWFSAGPAPPDERPLMQFEVELKSRGVLGSEVGTDVVLSPDG